MIERKYLVTRGILHKAKTVRGTTRDTCDRGVDLMLNIDASWADKTIGSTTDECHTHYRGKAPFSESETQSLKTFIDLAQNQIRFIMNFNSFGNSWIAADKDDAPEAINVI